MFSLFFLIHKAKSYQSLHISNQGFYTLSMVEESDLRLDLTNKTAIFYRTQEGEMFTVEVNKYDSKIKQMVYLIQFPEGYYSLHMNKAITLVFWVIDAPICPEHIFYLQTENKMSINYEVPNISSPLCFFIQPDFSSAYFSTSILDDENLTSEFRSSVLIGEPVKECPNPRRCSEMFSSPFFYRLVGGQNKLLSIKAEIKDPLPSIKKCMLESIDDEFLVNSKKEVYCDTFSDDLILYSYGLWIALAVVAIFFISKRYFCPHAFQPSQMEKRFKDLKNDPYAKSLGQPHGETVEDNV